MTALTACGANRTRQTIGKEACETGRSCKPARLRPPEQPSDAQRGNLRERKAEANRCDYLSLSLYLYLFSFSSSFSFLLSRSFFLSPSVCVCARSLCVGVRSLCVCALNCSFVSHYSSICNGVSSFSHCASRLRFHYTHFSIY